MIKTCSRCKVEKPISSFSKDKYRSDKLNCQCRSCKKYYKDLISPDELKNQNDRTAINRYKYYKNPDRKLKYRNAWLIKTYGINQDDYERMLLDQNGVCKICNKYRTQPGKNHLSVDHCHTTGKIRGLLCHVCNNTIGLFEEDIDLMLRAIEYIKFHKGDLK